MAPYCMLSQLVVNKSRRLNTPTSIIRMSWLKQNQRNLSDYQQERAAAKTGVTGPLCLASLQRLGLGHSVL
jgi:hypothetical protein